MHTRDRRWVVAGIILLAALALVAGTTLIAAIFFRPGTGFAPGIPRRLPLFGRSYISNGERIYFTGTSESGPPITAEMQGMHRMGAGQLACASCHGPDGRGGTVRMMMGDFEAPDILYSTLTEEEHGEEHEEHLPYTDETIRRAITHGLDPAGEPLDWVMPRWDMSGDQLDDLLDFLKTLDGPGP
jgi:mono/diheme cytochrome c family protein